MHPKRISSRSLKDECLKSCKYVTLEDVTLSVSSCLAVILEHRQTVTALVRSEEHRWVFLEDTWEQKKEAMMVEFLPIKRLKGKGRGRMDLVFKTASHIHRPILWWRQNGDKWSSCSLSWSLILIPHTVERGSTSFSLFFSLSLSHPLQCNSLVQPFNAEKSVFGIMVSRRDRRWTRFADATHFAFPPILHMHCVCLSPVSVLHSFSLIHVCLTFLPPFADPDDAATAPLSWITFWCHLFHQAQLI